jgi:hypothetical protein
MEALVAHLTRERVLVELLVFKLVTLRQMLLAGETRFLPWASEEVERATEVVRVAEVERAVLTATLGAERGLEDPALSELISDAPDPWRGLLEDSHAAMSRHALEIQELLQATRRLAEVGVRSLAEAMGDPQEAPDTYGPTGRVAATAARRYEQVL